MLSFFRDWKPSEEKQNNGLIDPSIILASVGDFSPSSSSSSLSRVQTLSSLVAYAVSRHLRVGVVVSTPQIWAELNNFVGVGGVGSGSPPLFDGLVTFHPLFESSESAEGPLVDQVNRHLYSVLREMDKLNVDLIVAEGLESNDESAAFNNRIKKAAARTMDVSN